MENCLIISKGLGTGGISLQTLEEILFTTLKNSLSERTQLSKVKLMWWWWSWWYERIIVTVRLRLRLGLFYLKSFQESSKSTLSIMIILIVSTCRTLESPGSTVHCQNWCGFNSAIKPVLMISRSALSWTRFLLENCYGIALKHQT